MTKMRSLSVILIVLILIICTFFLGYPSVAASKTISQFSGQLSSSKLAFDKQVAIHDFFKGKQMTSLEGIWKWQTLAGKYEGAIIDLDKLSSAKIIRKAYGREIQYACFLTQSMEILSPGTLKMVIKEPIGGIYKGYYIVYESSGFGISDSDELPIKLSVISRNTLSLEATTRTGERETNEAVRVYPPKGDRSFSENILGTGFFVAPDVVVTCYSNVAEANEIRIKSKKGAASARLLVKDEANDLALLKLDSDETVIKLGVPLVIGDIRTVSKGSKVSSPMYKHSLRIPSQIVIPGVIVKQTGEKNDPRVFETDIFVDCSSKGAPLLNNSFQAIGILTSLAQNPYFKHNSIIPEGISYAVKINNLFNLASSTRECPRLFPQQNPSSSNNRISICDSIVMVESLFDKDYQKSIYDLLKE